MSRHATAALMLLGMAAVPTATAIAGVGDLEYVAEWNQQQAELNGVRFSATKFSTMQPTGSNGLVCKDIRVGHFAVAGGDVLVALDAKRAGAERPGVARLDLSGKGDFSRAVELPLKPVHDYPGQIVYDFQPTRITRDRAGGEHIAWAWGKYVRGRLRDYMYLRLYCALAGECAFGEKVHRVRMEDRTGNLKVTDRFDPVTRRSAYDLVWIGEGPTRQGAPAGLAVAVDGTWYEIALTGRKVAAKALAPEMSRAQVGSPRWRCTLHGKRFHVELRGGREPVRLPADTYIVRLYSVSSGSEPGSPCVTGIGASRPIVVKPGVTTGLPIGTGPIRAEIAATVQGRNVALRASLSDAMGLRIADTESLGRGKPRVEVVGAAGAVVHRATLEYG